MGYSSREQPGVQVGLDEIDFADQRFRVRRGRRAPSDAPNAWSGVHPALLLWIRRRPFTVLRGFRHIERAITEPEASRASSVRVAFLEDLQDDVSFIAAMRAACMGPNGRCDLSTLECARAIRVLESEGHSTTQVRSVFQELAVPTRSLTRALALARSHETLWKAADGQAITVAVAEAILGAARTYERSRRFGSDVDSRTCATGCFIRSVVEEASRFQVTVRKLENHLSRRTTAPMARRKRSDMEPKFPKEPRAWQLSRKKRLIVYHQNIGVRQDPEFIKALITKYGKLIEILSRWLESSTHGNRNGRPDPNVQ
jgi:hypothetical protein